MQVEERPLVFDCAGSPLIGIAHVPEQPLSVGILTVAAGGIQYRAGCGRQLITLARELAAGGTPVMRFDHRGHGDSGGVLLGFQHMDEDLARAVQVFRENVPGLSHVVLYGGCEAASGIMISAWQLPDVKSVILANPWVDVATVRAAVSRKHYRQRLFDAVFWKKLFSGQYNLLDYGRQFLNYLGDKLTALFRSPVEQVNGDATDEADLPFEERMLAGFEKFDGRVLFLKSGMSFVSEEFDQLVASSGHWQRVCNRPSVSRLELPEADQTFSTAVSRRDICKAATEWVAAMEKDFL